MSKIEGLDESKSGMTPSKKESLPAVDDVKGVASKAIQPDDVKGAHGNLMPASKARNL